MKQKKYLGGSLSMNRYYLCIYHENEKHFSILSNLETNLFVIYLPTNGPAYKNGKCL